MLYRYRHYMRNLNFFDQETLIWSFSAIKASELVCNWNYSIFWPNWKKKGLYGISIFLHFIDKKAKCETTTFLLRRPLSYNFKTKLNATYVSYKLFWVSYITQVFWKLYGPVSLWIYVKYNVIHCLLYRETRSVNYQNLAEQQMRIYYMCIYVIPSQRINVSCLHAPPFKNNFRRSFLKVIVTSAFAQNTVGGEPDNWHCGQRKWRDQLIDFLVWHDWFSYAAI